MSFSHPNKKRLPLACKVIYFLTLASALLYFAFTLSAPFADLFNQTVAAALRAFLGIITSPLPISLAELLLLSLPVLLVLLCIRGYRRYTDSWRDALTYLGIVASGLCVVLILFVWCFAAGYYAPTLDEKLDLERTPCTAEELYDTAEALREELVRLEADVDFGENGASVMPYDLSEMNSHLMTSYDALSEKTALLSTFPTRVKPVLLSEAMSYTHITGVYTFFTGEANVNVHFPDYTIPYTAAHELAHQRGIAREDEANLVAYLVCRESDDPYIRYSGTLGLYEYLLSALAKADRELYRESYLALPESIKGEERAYAEFFEPYRDSTASKISSATNDAYLKGQGESAGTKSYGMVVDLAVAMHKRESANP